MEERALHSNLGKLIQLERAKRVTIQEGNPVSLEEIITDIAQFCRLGSETVKAYKIGRTYPSLPVALKLSEYFHVSVNDIYGIKNYELAITNNAKKGRKTNRNKNGEKVITLCHCGKVAIAKKLCMNHYQTQRRKAKEDEGEKAQ